MAGLACAEWNMHAWDLARSLGKDYRPADPDLVFAGWWEGTPQMRPADDAVPVLVSAPVDGDAWDTLLRVSGSDPGWAA